MENKEVNVTYETLFEILRIEKDKEDLQKLSKTFFEDVIDYLREKEGAIDKAILENSGERRKLDYELENTRRIIKDLYERREKKIVNLALNISRTKSKLIDTSSLLHDEKCLFDSLILSLDTGREDILKKILELRAPCFTKPAAVERPVLKDEAEPSKPDNAPEPEQESSFEEPESSQGEQEAAAEGAPDIAAASQKQESPKTTKMVRFLNPVPKFVGKELEEYGPFEEEDVANIPAEIADILISKDKAEEIVEEYGD